MWEHGGAGSRKPIVMDSEQRGGGWGNSGLDGYFLWLGTGQEIYLSV